MSNLHGLCNFVYSKFNLRVCAYNLYFLQIHKIQVPANVHATMYTTLQPIIIILDLPPRQMVGVAFSSLWAGPIVCVVF